MHLNTYSRQVVTMAFVFAAAAVGRPVAVRNASSPLADRGHERTITAGGGKAPYSVTLSEKSRAYRDEDDGIWGVGPGAPVRAVTQLLIERRGQRDALDVPRSCYADLANISSVKLKPKPGGVVVTIEGGDAGNGYTVQLVLRGGKITERSVRDGEFPSNYWERTLYHNTPVAE